MRIASIGAAAGVAIVLVSLFSAPFVAASSFGISQISGEIFTPALSSSSEPTLVKQWNYQFGKICYRMTFGPSPGVADLGYGDENLEIVTGNDEWYPQPNVSGRWFAFDANGNVLWTLNTGNDESRSSVAIADIDQDGDLEIAGGTTSGWHVQVFDHMGNMVWTFAVGYYGFVHSSPAIADACPNSPGLEVIAASYDGLVYTIDSSGGLVWTYGKEGGDIWVASPAIGDVDADGALEVIIGSSNFKLFDDKIFAKWGSDKIGVYSIDGATGTLKWVFRVGTAFISSAALANLDDDAALEVVVGGIDGKIYCLDGSTGTLQWVYTTGGSVYSSPAVGDVNADGRLEVVVGSNDGKVYCLDAATGSLVWEYQTGGAVYSSPALANRGSGGLDIFVGSEDCYLYLVDGKAGVLIDKFLTTGPIRSSPIVADIDGDEKLEILFVDWNKSDGNRDWFWCLEDTKSSVSKHVIEWGMFRHDERRTGLYPMGEQLIDTTPPTSHVDPISPYWRNSIYIPITATASDALSGVADVKLYYRHSSDNTTWSTWVEWPYKWNNGPKPWSWLLDTLWDGNGDIYYEFYTIAEDKAGNVESAPISADARCGIDLIVPTSSVDPIEPYWRDSTTITLTATASDALSGVAGVTLYYRHSADNITFTPWTKIATDTVVPWGWNLDLTENIYYEFYSVAQDVAGNVEAPPRAKTIPNINENLYWALHEGEGLPVPTETSLTIFRNENGYIVIEGSGIIVVEGRNIFTRAGTINLEGEKVDEDDFYIFSDFVYTYIEEKDGVSTLWLGEVGEGITPAPEEPSLINYYSTGEGEGPLGWIVDEIGTILFAWGAPGNSQIVDNNKWIFVLVDGILYFPGIIKENPIIADARCAILQPEPESEPTMILAGVRIKPEVINLTSKGVFTVFITFPEGYSVTDIDLSTVVCEGAQAKSGKLTTEGELAVKFKVQDLNVEPGTTELVVTGALMDGTQFIGSDFIIGVTDPSQGDQPSTPPTPPPDQPESTITIENLTTENAAGGTVPEENVPTVDNSAPLENTSPENMTAGDTIQDNAIPGSTVENALAENVVTDNVSTTITGPSENEPAENTVTGSPVVENGVVSSSENTTDNVLPTAPENAPAVGDTSTSPENAANVDNVASPENTDTIENVSTPGPAAPVENSSPTSDNTPPTENAATEPDNTASPAPAGPMENPTLENSPAPPDNTVCANNSSSHTALAPEDAPTSPENTGLLENTSIGGSSATTYGDLLSWLEELKENQFTSSSHPYDPHSAKGKLKAIVNIDPNVIEIGSKGKLTASIELPVGHRSADINPNSVACMGARGRRGRVVGGKFLVEFDVDDLTGLTVGEVELTVTGELRDGTSFEGSDVVVGVMSEVPESKTEFIPTRNGMPLTAMLAIFGWLAMFLVAYVAREIRQ